MVKDKFYPKALTTKRFGMVIAYDKKIVTDLAKRLNADDDTIKHYKKKSRGIPERNLITICQYLNMEPSMFTDELSDDEFYRIFVDRYENKSKTESDIKSQAESEAIAQPYQKIDSHPASDRNV